MAKDTAICSDETLLIATNKAFSNYVWSTGSLLSSITAPVGYYWVTVKDFDNCLGVDSIKVNLKDCATYFYMPTAFSPNADGTNDVLKPYIAGRIQQFSYSIYNRYGQRIFTTTNTNQAWDGTINGTAQPVQTYIWVISYQAKYEQPQLRKGTVVLIR